ncbi:hypothetical protein M3212_21900, partial [Alkalihalobacillus oceani]
VLVCLSLIQSHDEVAVLHLLDKTSLQSPVVPVAPCKNGEELTLITAIRLNQLCHLFDPPRT